MGPGQADLFTVDATAGQFLHVIGNQNGIAVWLRIVDPEGKALVTAVGHRTPRTESASAIAPRSGFLHVRFEALPENSRAGHYTIELTDLRDSTKEDRLRIDAETKRFAAYSEDHDADPAIRRKAIEHYTEAASLWRDLGDGYEQALGLHGIGDVYISLGEKQKALDYYQQELALDRSVKNRENEVLALGSIGDVYSDLGEKQKAVEYFSQTLPLYRAMGNGANEVRMLNTVGRLYVDLGEKQKALDSYTQALSLSRAAGTYDDSTTLGNLNSLYELPAPSTPVPASAKPTPVPSAAAMQVRLMAQSGHTDRVSAIAFSPDGRFVLSAAAEEAAILWSVDDGKEIRRFEGHESKITSVAFLPDGKSVATGNRDKTVRIWDLQTGQELQRLTDSMPIESISISPKGDLIATAGSRIPDSMAAHLWDRQSGKNIRSFEGHTGSIRVLAFSPDGKWLATASDDHTTRLWDVATGAEVRRFTALESIINAIAFSPDGTMLATGSGASDLAVSMGPALDTAPLIRLWNVSSGTEIRRIDAPAAVLSLAFSFDSRYLASGGGNGYPTHRDTCAGCDVRLLDVRSGQEVNRFPAGGSQSSQSPVGVIAFSPNRMLVARSERNEVVIAATDSGKEVSRLRGYSQSSVALSMSPDNRFTSTEGDTVALWDHQTGTPSPVFPRQDPRTVAFSPDGATLVTSITVPGSPGRQIGFWDLRTHREIRRLSKPGAFSYAYSPDGRFFLVGTAQQLCLVEASTGAEVRCPQDFLDASFNAFFSPAGDATIAFSQNDEQNEATVRVWDTKTGAPLRSFKPAGRSASLVAVSPVGEVIAINSNSTCLYNWRTGELLGELFTGLGGISMAFSPNGRWLALTTAGSFSVSIWDTSTGRGKWEFPFLNTPTDVKFSPDGQSFPIGLLSDEDKRAIPLANPKPQLMQVRCHDDQDGDPLGLAQRVRDLLMEASQPVTRGSAGSEPALAYSDEVPDGIPSAMSPRVAYKVQGGKLEATVRLYRDNQIVSDETLTLSADPTAAARQIADAITKAATTIGP